MDKFLFLDMDGVVNSVEYSIGSAPFGDGMRHDESDPVKLGLIRFICEQTDTKVVVSSTWRVGRTVDWFVGYFEHAGWPIAPIIGLTQPVSRKPHMVGRGDEVLAWLKDHPTDGNRRHVILDDDNDFYPDQPLIKCNGVYGITLKETLQAIEVLGLGDNGDEKLISDLQSHVDFKSQ